MKHALVAYEVSISKRRKPTESLPLDNFDGRGASLIRQFAGYVNSLADTGLIQRDSRHYGLPHDVKMEGHTYRCKIVSGTSGILSTITKPDGSGSAYRRDAADIEQINFNTYFVQPPNSNVGFLLVETVAGRSIGQPFRALFIKLFRHRFPDVLLTIARTAETDAWKQAERAGQQVSVKSITAIHRGISANAYSQFGVGGKPRKVGEYHTFLDFKDEPESPAFLKKARETFFAKNNRIAADGGTITIADGDDGGPDEDDANELVAQVSYPDRTQTIRVTGARPPAIIYAITPVGAEDPDAAFRRESRAVAKSLVEQTDCQLPSKWDDGDWHDAENLPRWAVMDLDDDAQAASQSG